MLGPVAIQLQNRRWSSDHSPPVEGPGLGEAGLQEALVAEFLSPPKCTLLVLE